jgi:hypothetical protein
MAQAAGTVTGTIRVLTAAKPGVLGSDIHAGI